MPREFNVAERGAASYRLLGHSQGGKWCFGVNARGTFFTVQKALALMTRSGSDRSDLLRVAPERFSSASDLFRNQGRSKWAAQAS